MMLDVNRDTRKWSSTQMRKSCKPGEKVAMSILYRVVDLGKAETPVFQIEKTYQNAGFSTKKLIKKFKKMWKK